MKVLMLAAAEQDLLDAAYHYETATEGLGADFVAEFVRVQRVLAHSHQIGEKVDPIHRRARLHRFPYGVVYRCQGDVVKVVAIAHHRRRSRYWQYRVQERPATYLAHP